MAFKKKKKVTKRRSAARLLRKKKVVKPVPPVDPNANPAAPAGYGAQPAPGAQTLPQGYGV